MTSKRSLFLFLSLVMGFILVLAACGNTENEPGQEGSGQEESGENETENNDDGANEGGAGGEVHFGMINWAENIATTHLWKEILEQEGYTVNITQLDAAALFTGIADGSLDVFQDVWLPGTHAAYWDQFGDDVVDLGIWYEGQADLGIAVPDYVEAQSIPDLADYADEFNSQIIGIDAGAGIMTATDETILGYELDYELVTSGEAAMLTALDDAIDNEEAIAVTAWRPHWKFTEWDIRYLDDPEGFMGEAEEVHSIANPEFAENNEEVITWLENFSMSDEQLGTLSNYIFNEGMDEQEAGARWIEENPGVVDGWLGR